MSGGQQVRKQTAGTAQRAEQELVRRIRRSDEQAFKQLYMQYYEQLFRFVWRRVQNEEAAKDLMQTLFIRVWQNRHSLDAGQAVKAYLYQVATNLVIDHFRQRGRHPTISTEQLEPTLSNPEDRTFELEELVEQAIASLPESIRTVYTLSRVAGLKNAEIAERLGVSIKTVESRMTKAFSMLRDKLSPLLLLWLCLQSALSARNWFFFD